MIRDLRIFAEFKDCVRPKMLKDIQELAHFLHQHGFHVVRFVALGSQEITLVQDVDAYIAQFWEFPWPPNMGNLNVFQMRLQGMENLISSFTYHIDPNKCSSVGVGGLVNFEPGNQQAYVESFAQRLRELAMALYPYLQPSYGYLDESNANQTRTKEVVQRKLLTISWLNFFGPSYVEEYGQDFLLGLPGYKTELLPDGGVFHQLSPTFVALNEQEAKRLHQWVIGYCAEHGLKVTCRAPYIIPGLTPQPAPKEPVTDAEVQAYLQQALATTLVLTDGTRVKPISIPWDDLTPKQQQMALEAIRQAAIAEIKRPGRKRIRFEFNEIPDELEQMIADLVGWDNPDFEWVQVDMGSQ